MTFLQYEYPAAARFTLYEDDGTTVAFQQSVYHSTQYSVSEHEASFTIQRTVAADKFNNPDRRLMIRVYGMWGKFPDSILLNGAYLDTGDSRISYDADRGIVELQLESEFQFRTLEIVRY